MKDSVSSLKRRLEIVSISHHSCGRAIKQAMVLWERGWNISFVTNRIAGGSGAFKRKVFYDTPESFYDAIRLFSDKHIFHVHNEPSWQVAAIREIFPKAKIVFDVHDSNYWRTGTHDYSWYEEDVASLLCDAYVFPSKRAMQTFPKKRKPAIVVPSANPESLLYYGGWDYYGGLASNGGHVDPSKTHDGESWRDYTELYTQVLKKKKKIYAFCADFHEEKNRPELTKYYADLGVTPLATSHGELIKVLGRHDWSLCGNITDAPVWQVALPNKAFDSLSAGVPIMNINCPEVADLIDRYDVGINVKSVDEMIRRWGEHKEKRANVMLHRAKLTMDMYIKKLERLYLTLS